MDNNGAWLEQNLQANLPHPKGNIGILTIGRSKMLVKPAQLVPDLAGQHDGGPGNIINLADVIIFSAIWSVQSPVIPP